MKIDKNYDRRIRIKRYNKVGGSATAVYDAETGEPIDNVVSLDIHLSVKEDNWVQVTYYDPGTYEKEEDEIQLKVKMLKDPVIEDIEVYEAPDA